MVHPVLEGGRQREEEREREREREGRGESGQEERVGEESKRARERDPTRCRDAVM